MAPLKMPMAMKETIAHFSAHARKYCFHQSSLNQTEPQQSFENVPGGSAQG
jgi:hypothetical protein